jgi:tetratricopeptide (TPR) repeat protein
MKTGLTRKTYFPILFIVVLCLTAYSNTFYASFQFDDVSNIVDNRIIKDHQYFRGNSNTDTYSVETGLKNRYIGYLTFALNYKVHGLDVTGYHVINISIHIINALLIYWLVLLTFKTPHLSDRGKLESLSTSSSYGLIAVFSALLFASHPIQTQAVTYIVQRFASLATMFYLLSVVMYIMARLISQSAEVNIKDHGKKLILKSVFYYLISVVSAVLAMRTKEIAFTLPAIIVLYEFIFLEGKFKRRILYLIPIIITAFIIPLSLIATDKPIGEIISDVHGVTIETTMSRLDYLFTEFRVIITYIRLIFLPINQNLDYDYPLYHSFFNVGVFSSFIFLLTIFGLGVYLLYSYRHSFKYTRMISFGIFWFFLTLSVESSIIPIRDVIFEHRMYLPSIGLFIAISSSVFMFVERKKGRWKNIERTVEAGLVVIVITLTVVTYARNNVWKDPVTLWEDVVSKSPKKARGNFNLGIAYKSKGLIDKAIEQYRIAIKVKPDYPDAHNNLGNAYQSKGLIDKAIEHHRIAIRVRPDYPVARINLGNAYQSKGLIDKAIEQYRTAIGIRPDYPDVHNNIGVAFQSQGLIDKAIDHYLIAIKVKPDYPDAHINLGNAYQSKGLIDKAIEQYRIAIRVRPDYPVAHNNLGNAYQSKGLIDKAIEQYRIAIKGEPGYPDAHYNLGLAYFYKGRTDKATEYFEKAARLFNHSAKSQLNIGISYK